MIFFKAPLPQIVLLNQRKHTLKGLNQTETFLSTTK
jgi:hypothetical protein